MKEGIHPAYKEVKASCSCGAVHMIKSAMNRDTMNLDVCGNCHPFYTGQQRLVDTAGRVDKFAKRYKTDKYKTQHAAG